MVLSQKGSSVPERVAKIKHIVDDARKSTRERVNTITFSGDFTPELLRSRVLESYRGTISDYKKFRKIVHEEIPGIGNRERLPQLNKRVTAIAFKKFPQAAIQLTEFFFEEQRMRRYLADGKPYYRSAEDRAASYHRNHKTVMRTLRKLGVNSDSLNSVMKAIAPGVIHGLRDYDPFEQSLHAYLANLVSANYKLLEGRK